MNALVGAAMVNHAHNARHQTKGSGPGLVPLPTRPRSWGKGGVRGLAPPPLSRFLGCTLLVSVLL